MKTYLGHWSFNSPVFSGLEALTGGASALRALPFLLIILGGLVVGWKREEPLRMIPMFLFAFLVIGPTLHPWYALWLIAFLPFLPTSVKGAAFAFVALLPLTYVSAWTFAQDGVWVEPIWTRWVVWGVPGALFIAGTIRNHVRRSE